MPSVCVVPLTVPGGTASGGTGGGDMTKAVYDTNPAGGDGRVNAADHATNADNATNATNAANATNATTAVNAQNVPWAGVSGKPAGPAGVAGPLLVWNGTAWV